MKFRIYTAGLPEEAKKIRLEVFVKEQGFEEEFDSVDDTAAHIVLFDGKTPVGVCRVFKDSGSGKTVIGRVAVKKELRGKGLGTRIIEAAEKYAAGTGISAIRIHSQERAAGFYRALGYRDTGESDLDEAARTYGWKSSCKMCKNYK